MSNVVFEEPDLSGIIPARRQPTGFLEDFQAGREAQLNIENINARAYARDRTWGDYLDEVERVSGTRFPHPFRSFIPEIEIPAIFGATDEDGNAKVEFVTNRIERLREDNPELQVAGPEWMDARVREDLAQVDARAREAEFVPAFLGHIAGAFQDPITLATLPIGGGEVTLLRTFLVEAGINALAAAGTEPIANKWRRELGLDTATLGESALNVGISAVAGGTLGVGFRVAGRTVRNALDDRALARFAREIRQNDPEIAAAADAMDAWLDLDGENPFAWTNSPDPRPRNANPADDMEASAEHANRFRAAVGLLTEDPGSDAAQAAAEVLSQPPASPVRSQTVARPPGLVDIDPSTVNVDAARFQFKSDGDASGLTDRLQGVTEWDPVRAGVAVLFEQADGRQFIVDGHQRLGLARRLQDDDNSIRLTGFVFREEDGWSDIAVRTMAAAKNLAEGTGTTIDAAKVLRVDPALLDASLPQRSAQIRDARDLMGLSDDGFGMVVNEIVAPAHGAVVGRRIADPDEQLAVLEMLSRLEPRSAFEAEAIVRQAQEAGFRKTEGETGSLFGDEAVESLMGTRASILSAASRMIKSEKQVFSTLAREADRIEAAGNSLARATNAERAQNDGTLLEILQALAHRKGPISDALTEAAQSGGSIAAGARGFLRALRDRSEKGDLEGLLSGANRRGSEPFTTHGETRAQRGPPLGPEDPYVPREGFDGTPEDAATRAMSERLEAESKAADQDDLFAADLFEDPEVRTGGATRTRAEVEADIEADRAANERARICTLK